MKTITNSEFLSNPEMYFGMSHEQDVCVRNGRQVYRIIHESCDDDDDDELTDNELTDDQIWALFESAYPDGLPPLLSDEEEIANSISFDELMAGIQEDIHRKWAQRRV